MFVCFEETIRSNRDTLVVTAPGGSIAVSRFSPVLKYDKIKSHISERKIGKKLFITTQTTVYDKIVVLVGDRPEIVFRNSIFQQKR